MYGRSKGYMPQSIQFVCIIICLLNNTSLTLPLCIEVLVPRVDNEQLCICVLEVSILSLFTILELLRPCDILYYFHSIILFQIDINSDNIKTVIETVKNRTSDPGILTNIDVIAVADVLGHIPNDTLINQAVSYSFHFILQIKIKHQRIPKGQSRKDNPEKLAHKVHKRKKNKLKT